MLGKRDLARAVAFVHAANLRNGDVRLVDDTQKIFWEVVDERIRRLTWLTTVKMTRIVFDAAAKTHRLEHLEIVVGSHFETLGLEQLAFFPELRETFAQFILDGLQRAVHLGTRRHVVRSRPNGKRLVRAQLFTADIIDLDNALNFVAPELDADRIVGIGREHVERVAAYTKRPAFKLVVIAVVLDVDQTMDHVVAICWHLLVEEHGHACVIHRRTDAVDATDRCDHDDIAP